MQVFALIFTIGISTGSKSLLGLFNTKEKAEEKREKHMRKSACAKHHYYIKEIEVNKEIDITFAEW